jgi:hypothetical protein
MNETRQENGDSGKPGRDRTFTWLSLKGGMWIVLLSALGATIVQHAVLLASPAAAAAGRTLSVVMGLAALCSVALLGRKKDLGRFFGSVKFAVPVLFFVTLYSVIGTLVVQGMQGEGLSRIYGGGLASLFEMLFFQDIFHSFGFSVILGMGSGGLILALFPLAPFTLVRVGKMLSHLGIIITLAGSGVGSLWGVKGDMGLTKGQTKDRFIAGRQAGEAPREIPLGFALRLEDFQVEFYEPSFRVRIFDITDERPALLASFDPAGEETADLEKRFGVAIRHYWPRYERVVEPVPLDEKAAAGEDEVVTALGLVAAAGAPGEKAWLFTVPGESPQVMQVKGDLRVALVWSLEEAESYAASVSTEEGDRHILKIGGQEMEVEPGGAYDLPGHDVKFRVRQFFNDFVIDMDSRQPTNRSDKPLNPAIQVVFLDEAGSPSGQGWLFARFGSFHGAADGSPLSMMKYTYVEGRKAGSRDILVVGESREVWTLAAGKETLREPLDLSGTKELDHTGFAATDLVERARIETRHLSRPEGALNPVVEISVDGGEPFLVGAGKAVRLSENEALVLSEQEENIRDYLSTLSVMDGGRTVLTKTIEVNAPLSYGGYSFYQSNYDPNRPGWTGLEVVRDPGMSLVYLGLMVLLAGVITVIFAVPVRKKIKGGRRGPES